MKSIGFMDAVEERYGRYSRHVLGFRHFPEGRDGMLPVQRRAIWTFHKNGSESRGHSMKTSKAGGYTCFAAGTPVATPYGSRVVEHMNVGDLALTSRGVYPVTRRFHNPPEQTLLVIMADGNCVATPEQEFKVVIDGQFFWKRADELLEGDEIVAL